MNVMRTFDSILVWIIVLAIVTVLVASGSTDKLIQAMQEMLTSLIQVVTSPQTGGRK
jgi:hypothetical protein